MSDFMNLTHDEMIVQDYVSDIFNIYYPNEAIYEFPYYQDEDKRTYFFLQAIFYNEKNKYALSGPVRINGKPYALIEFLTFIKEMRFKGYHLVSILKAIFMSKLIVDFRKPRKIKKIIKNTKKADKHYAELFTNAYLNYKEYKPFKNKFISREYNVFRNMPIVKVYKDENK